MSQRGRRANPSPTAAPFTAATMGFGKLINALMNSLQQQIQKVSPKVTYKTPMTTTNYKSMIFTGCLWPFHKHTAVCQYHC
jgi:hypothetical protein